MVSPMPHCSANEMFHGDACSTAQSRAGPPAVLVQQAQALEPALLVVLEPLQLPDAFLKKLQRRRQRLLLTNPDLQQQSDSFQCPMACNTTGIVLSLV